MLRRSSDVPTASRSPEPSTLTPQADLRSRLTGSGSARRGRLIRGVALGALTAAVIVWGRRSGVLDGWAGLTLTALVALAVPTSRLLSRRILLTGVLALGWLPILWWWQLPTGGMGRVTLLLAATAGGLVGWVGAGSRPGCRARQLVPRAAWVDAIPAGALAAATAMLWPWLRVRSGADALALLTGGWDHSAHFDMAEMIRVHGVVISGIAPPPGATWSYLHYPQGYHTVAAAMMELTGSVAVGTPAAEVALYARAMGLVAVIATVVVTAGIAALPRVRRSPAAAAAAAATLTVAILCGPGAFILSDGFPNFFLACALLCTVPLIAIPTARWTAPLQVAALGGAIVGVAHSWAMLLTLAAPVALVVLLPTTGSRARASRGRWILLAVIAVATAAASLVAIAVIRVQPLTSILVIGGGVSVRGRRELIAVVSLAFLLLGLLAVRTRRPWSPAVLRTVWTAAGLGAGVAFVIWIATVQESAGGLGYYFWKYAIALELVAVVLGAAAAGMLVARLPGVAGRSSRIVARALVGAAVLVITFSAAQPVGTMRLPALVSSGASAHERLTTASRTPANQLDDVLAAVSVAPPKPARSVYLPIGGGPWPNPASLSQWSSALAGTWTDDLNPPIGTLLDADLSPSAAPALAGRLLSSDPTIVVVVAPQYASGVRAGVDAPDRHRVLTW